MRSPKLKTLGYNAGWKAGLAYATGTRRDRAAVRAKLARLSGSYSDFADGYRRGVEDRVEQRAEAIEAGLVARTIRPSKLRYLVAHQF